MSTGPEESVFLLGKDYHLGDLLWFTAVLRAYRDRFRPATVTVLCPDRPISRILERNPLIEHLRYGDLPPAAHSICAKPGSMVRRHDLRVVPLGFQMVQEWRRRPPWLYYRDLWLEPRGQWLATLLGLGTLGDGRPVLCLDGADRLAAREISHPYVVLAPHIGQYSFRLAGAFWRGVKGWPVSRWERLAHHLRVEGYEPVTLAAAGQPAIAGTHPLTGLRIRQAAGVIESASALVTGESGLWLVAAALNTPFIIVPWWLPKAVDWAAASGVRYRLVYRDSASVNMVLEHVRELAQQQ
jgi:hypothetical protein